MKKIELVVLKLRDFKGIKSLDIQLDGGNAKIYGDNAVGKTTVFDGFLWLLFDKDSNNKKVFSIKTLDSTGEELHNLEHTVEGSFLIDDVLTKFKKVYKEKWTKKRGQAQKTFDGHDVDHFIDDVPMSKTEYSKRVKSIVDEELFKLLTSPTYFNEQLKWQEKRKLLLEICGDISDEDVIASNKELSKLNDLLNGKSLEDMKKIIASNKKHINEEIEKIPVRIDEINKMMPETTIDVEKMRKQVAKIEVGIEELQEQKIRVKNGSSVLEKQRQLQELEMKLSDLKRTFEADSMQEINKLRVRVQETQGNVQIIQSEIKHKENYKKTKENELQQLSQDIQHTENLLTELRKDWTHHNNTQFEYEDKCECPSCKQPLPVDQVEAARNKALAQFNEEKSNVLSTVNEKGKTLAHEKERKVSRHNEVNNDLFSANMELDAAKNKLETAQKEFAKYQDKLKQAEITVPDVTAIDEYKSINLQIETLQAEIKQLNEHAYEAVTGIDEEIAKLNFERKECNSGLAQFANIETGKDRIVELEDQQAKLSQEYDKLDQISFLIEEFIRTKVNMLTERINSKFKYARFKLFHQQVDGGLQEVCETLYEGVPYSTGLNNAAQINVGLDIINTLSAHYGIQAPIFVDNAEAVTKFIDVESQLVSLVVSEKDKQLRVEVDKESVQQTFKEAI